jgi:hypothetical protein
VNEMQHLHDFRFVIRVEKGGESNRDFHIVQHIAQHADADLSISLIATTQTPKP